ncbi:MAG: hypothetical protein ABI644_10830, partial [Arenimonas sp.]
MNSDSRNLFERYQPYKRWAEIGFWVFNCLIHLLVDSAVVLLDVDRLKLDFATWQPIVWETSSSL